MVDSCRSVSYSSKNPYGNKTDVEIKQENMQSYSSKNPYGNKTQLLNEDFKTLSYSSKNPYGNKTSNTYYHIFD